MKNYEKMGNWEVSKELPQNIREILKESFAKIENGEYVPNNMHGTFFHKTSEAYGKTFGDQSYFILAKIFGGGSGTESPFIPPDPYNSLESYFTGEIVDCHPRDSSYDHLPNNPIVAYELIALEQLSKNIHEMDSFSDERSKVIEEWKQNPDTKYRVKLTFDWKNRSARIDPEPNQDLNADLKSYDQQKIYDECMALVNKQGRRL